jgi:hypothetical protein
MRVFKIGDIVKFVPYYAASGMQGASLKKKPPIYSCLGFVTKTSKSNVCVMIPTGAIIVVGLAKIKSIASL